MKTHTLDKRQFAKAISALRLATLRMASPKSNSTHMDGGPSKGRSAELNTKLYSAITKYVQKDFTLDFRFATTSHTVSWRTRRD